MEDPPGLIVVELEERPRLWSDLEPVDVDLSKVDRSNFRSTWFFCWIKSEAQNRRVNDLLLID